MMSEITYRQITQHRWCRFGIFAGCPLGIHCDYVHIEQWLNRGCPKMHRMTCREKFSLMQLLEDAAESAKDDGSDALLRIHQNLKRYGMYRCEDDLLADTKSLIHLICGVLHFDIKGMNKLLRLALRTLIYYLAPYVNMSPDVSIKMSYELFREKLSSLIH
eukprot:TRINITY_DN37736_c0_g1_i1.p1 TRINITY_DN37736_c0_g1~~TRINITY_DN37736_c0_g1_i1.p1  ORF type:complete len:161 (+),score=14.76 TRINITY_DN37736_c0_g1_i1:34-516(+)